MKLAVAYCRVSTDSEEQKNSITEQRTQWEEFFKNTDAEPAKCGLLYKKNGTKEPLIGGIYVDEGISGTSLKNRRAFKQMIEDAKLKKFDMIYVEDGSRFSRSTEDALKTIKDLRELGIGIFFKKENINSIDSNSDMMLTFLFAFYTNESQMKSKRVKWSMYRLQLKGGWNSTAPFGYDIENAFLKINESEAETVKKIFNLYLDEGFGISKIARYLNNNKILTKKGVLWSRTQVSAILNNKLYIGEQRTHTVESSDITRNSRIDIPIEDQIVNQFERLRIIDDEKFNLTQLEMKQRNEQFSNGTGHSNKHLFSTLLYCSYCGATFKRKKRHTYKRKDGTRKDLGFEWSCGINDMYGKDRCDHRNALTEENLIQTIKNELQMRKKDNLTNLFEMYYNKKFKDNIDITMLNSNKGKLMAQMNLLRKDKLDNLIDDDIYKEEMKALNKNTVAINAEISRYERRQFEIENAKLKFNEYLEMLKTIDVENLTNTQLKRIFSKILVKERIFDGKKSIYVCFRYKFLDIKEDELFEDDEETISLWVKVA